MTTSPRRKLRYAPDKLDQALIMFNGSSPVWAPDDSALIIDESAMSGAQLVVRFNDKCKPGSKIRVKLGNMEPLLSEVVWRREIDADLIRLGIQFLE
jgi:hypothetical protein